MKTYFDNGAAMEFSNKGPQGAGYTVRIAKEGFSYKSLNGKVDADVKFAEIGALDLTGYCSQNAGYKVRLRGLNMRDMGLPELELDTIPCDNAHNIRESKPLLIAFAASKLGAEFPNNLFSLETELGETPASKELPLLRCHQRRQASSEACGYQESQVREQGSTGRTLRLHEGKGRLFRYAEYEASDK